MKQYSLIYFDYDSLSEENHKNYKFKKKHPYIFFGEIPSMEGHCIVMDYETGEMFSGYHTCNFKEIPKDEL